MTDHESPEHAPKRGILKNSAGPTFPFQPATLEEVRENTAHNANLGGGRLQSSGPSSDQLSRTGSRPDLDSPTAAMTTADLMRRRQSQSSTSGSGPAPPTTDSNNTRLKWDEVNLYLAEQQRSSKMKITEPKTPYAPQYNPDDDMDDISDLGGGELGSAAAGSLSDTGLSNGFGSGIDGHSVRDDGSITSLSRRNGFGVDPDLVRDRLEGQNGTGPQSTAAMDEEELKKHREFEKHRKEHYKVPVDIKTLLGRKAVDDDEEDEN